MESFKSKKTLRARVRHEYTRRGYTQTEFAEAVEMEQPTLAKKLGGTRKITLDEVQKMADKLTEKDPKNPVWAGFLAFGYPPDDEIFRVAEEISARLKEAAKKDVKEVTPKAPDPDIELPSGLKPERESARPANQSKRASKHGKEELGSRRRKRKKPDSDESGDLPRE